VLVSGTDRFTAADAEHAATGLRERLLAVPTTAPIPYRTRAGGDYDERFALLPEVAPGRTGLGVHLVRPTETPENCRS